ncbi:MAG: hypothetical protein HOV71_21590 [Hamadaea sp.]|nr:hypothetical protein [Hamadaea sp.]NUR50730.1 hypothetical protein [Hamadaea sp.]NUT03746.1 hypothetical protein [Hamadaea sp.]
MKLQFGPSACRPSTLAAATAGSFLVVSNPAFATNDDGFAALATAAIGSIRSSPADPPSIAAAVPGRRFA